jgi:CDP-2,3-bis-(O-geranylgeranyl)-sn-glycerol synthase
MHYLYILYLLLPAFAANMLPQLASFLNIFKEFNYPIDFSMKVFGKRIFGANKTWRGFIVGVAGSIIVAIIQYFFDSWDIIKISELEGFNQFLFFGFLAGTGALVGDAIESLIKRQLNIASGRPFVPFDQIDYLIGFLLFTNFLINWSWPEIIFILFCGAILNPIANSIAYIFKIKKTYW